MDLNLDGKPDVVSGSYQGGVLMFRGLGDGKFAAPTPINGIDGRPLRVGTALAPAFADWDADGDQDMILGTASGAVLLLLNQGYGRFDEPRKLKSETEEIEAKHGGPCVFDFDNDGVLDLLIGDVEGKLTLYFGTEAGSLVLSAPSVILPYSFTSDERETAGPQPEIRIKPTVVDWDNDGKMDVLLGDYRPTSRTLEVRSDAQKARISELSVQDSSLAYRIMTRSDELSKQAMKEVGIKDLRTASGEQRTAHRQALSRLLKADEQYLALQVQKEQREKDLSKALAQTPSSGTVWVMLRK